MTPPRSKAPEPTTIPLEPVKDPRSGLNLFRPTQEVTIGPRNRIAFLPGPRGLGWVLTVYEDPQEPEDEPPTKT